MFHIHIAGLINLKIHLLLSGGLTGSGYESVELATGVKREFALHVITAPSFAINE